MARESTERIQVFYSYADRDEFLRNELEKHLTILYRQELITSWHRRKIIPGEKWANEIDTHIDTAQLILLLISPDFLASDYCYEVEIKRALARHETGDALVIPILLRPVDWTGAPFEKLQVLPANGKPITSWSGRNGRDKAFLEVALGIRAAITEIEKRAEIAIQKRDVSTTSRDFSDSIFASFHANRAGLLYGHGHYEEALAIYEEALRLDPNDAASYSGKADILRRFRRYEEALRAYEEALRLDPNDADTYSQLGDTLYYGQRQYEKALAAYERTVSLDPSFEYLLKKIRSLERLGRNQEALSTYDQVLLLRHLGNRHYIQIYKDKARLLYSLGDYEKALMFRDLVLRLDRR